MRLTIAAVGRLKTGAERELVSRYLGRIDALGRTLAFGPLRIVELSESRATAVSRRKSDEAEALLKASKPAERRVALDESGKCLTSQAFAAFLRSERDAGTSDLAFLLGGPDGHGDEALRGNRLALSLSAMTLPHGLARVVLVEQLYRALTIVAGHPYHRD
ncbi:MAG: 23S rRNA (pseudouridine(1915)-N(3))-methyltransferase RlmH [Hyphomicrobiaceae bacterium]